MNDYGEMFYGTLPPDTQDFRQVLAGIGRTIRERAITAGQRIVESAREARALQEQAFGDPTRPTRVTDEAALRRLTDMIMAGPLGFAPAGITAWHGSPKLLSRFDIEKTGTGAGTTNFGHGTYFAEHPAIAGMFRKGRIPSTENPEGFIYKVDIPDELIPKMINWYQDVPESIRQPLSEKAMQEFGSGLSPSTGEKLYKEVAFNFKMKGSKTPEKDASNWLSKQGVPGIQYENMQMYKGQGRDTNNYVLFEPEKVKIEKINESTIEDWIAKGLL